MTILVNNMDNNLKKELKEFGRCKKAYDTNQYNFVNEIKKYFECSELSKVHEIYGTDFDILTLKTDQSTLYHKKFYSMEKNTKFYSMYRSFIKNEIQPLFKEEIIFQKIPTFRTQVPNNLGVAEWHKDSDYNHFKDEINVYLPLTKAYNNTTIWAESQPGKKDFTPMNADIGDYYIWHGSNLIHGNKVNNTNLSRVSIDFRVLPISKYYENDKKTTSHEMKMSLGHYFDKF